jgi:hypothetical protein
MSIADIDNDGEIEILVCGDEIHELNSYFFCFNQTGQIEWIIPNFTGFPILTDTNADNKYEIMIVFGEGFFTFHSNGTILYGNYLNFKVSEKLCVVDINNDKKLEIITSDKIGRVICYQNYLWNESSVSWWTGLGSYQHTGQPDSDGDSLDNLSEIQNYSTNPFLKDTDKDGLPDNWEIEYGLNPLSKDEEQDKDNDGFSNLQEFNRGLNPNKWDNYARRYGLFYLPIWVVILGTTTFAYIKLRPLTPKIRSFLYNTYNFLTRRSKKAKQLRKKREENQLEFLSKIESDFMQDDILNNTNDTE